MILFLLLAILRNKTKIGFSSELLYRFILFMLSINIHFSYTPPDYDTNPPSKFATGIQHPFALQVLLRYSRQNGVGLDSSYRHKNENRAPVTFLTTIDENSHMLPGISFITLKYLNI